MRKIFVCLASVLFLLTRATGAGAIGVEAAVTGWVQGPDGQVAYLNPLGSDGMDFDNDAGYDEEKRLGGRIVLDLPVLPNISLTATPMEFEGNGSKTFSFGGASIAGAFYSRTAIDHYDLALFYGVPFTGLASLGTVGIDLGINVRLLDVDIAVDDGLGNSDRVGERIYVPMGYIALQFKPFKKLSFETEGRGIAYSGNHYYDVSGRIRYSFTGPAFLAIGWRHEDMRIDEKDILAEVRFSGPFAETGFSF